MDNHVMDRKNRTPANAAYDLFITAASILSIVNLALIVLARNEDVDSVIFIINLFLSVIFLLDFLAHLRRAESKSRYFVREFGWADLLGSLPFPQFKMFRLFRLVRAMRILRGYGWKRLLADFVRYRAASTLLTVLLLILLLMEFGGIAIVSAEGGNPNANIKTGADAIWWIMVTITTVGYGDRFPVTQAGRLIGMAVMVAGVGVFGVFSGFLANFFVSAQAPETNEQNRAAVAAVTPRSSLAELQRLLEEQEAMHAALKAKLAELIDIQKRAQA